jgi:hypothetical protein
MTRRSAPWRCCGDRAEQPSLGEVAPARCTGIGSAVRPAGLLDLFAVLHVALAEALEDPRSPAISRWLAPSLATPASRSTLS